EDGHDVRAGSVAVVGEDDGAVLEVVDVHLAVDGRSVFLEGRPDGPVVAAARGVRRVGDGRTHVEVVEVGLVDARGLDHRAVALAGERGGRRVRGDDGRGRAVASRAAAP